MKFLVKNTLIFVNIYEFLSKFSHFLPKILFTMENSTIFAKFLLFF
jgi:hypothetical protein